MDPATKAKVEDMHRMMLERARRAAERREALYRMACGLLVVASLAATMAVVWRAMRWMG